MKCASNKHKRMHASSEGASSTLRGERVNEGGSGGEGVSKKKWEKGEMRLEEKRWEGVEEKKG